MKLIYPTLALLAISALAAPAWANPPTGTDPALPGPSTARGASNLTAVDPVPVNRPDVAVIGVQIAKIKDQAIQHLAQVSGGAEDTQEEMEHELVRVQEELAQAQVQLAQASAAVAAAAADAPEPPELPQPPEPPQPPQSPQPPMSYGGGGFGGNSFVRELGLASDMAGHGAAGALIIASSELEEKAMTEIREDMAVMARILTKAAERIAGRAGPGTAMGIPVFTVSGARQPQNLYLEGFGALFHLSVRYPLLAPPPEEEPKTEKEKPQDSTWERTKRELYGPKVGAEHSAFAATGMPLTPHYPEGYLLWDQGSADQKPIEYDASRVESLKKTLLEALQNASNIRHLDPEQTITLAVHGGGQPIVKRVEVKGETGRQRRVAPTTAGGARQSMMTIRVKKADIDALAKGAIALDEFTKRPAVAIYPVAPDEPGARVSGVRF
jgi:hypothetical protein